MAQSGNQGAGAGRSSEDDEFRFPEPVIEPTVSAADFPSFEPAPKKVDDTCEI